MFWYVFNSLSENTAVKRITYSLRIVIDVLAVFWGFQIGDSLSQIKITKQEFNCLHFNDGNLKVEEFRFWWSNPLYCDVFVKKGPFLRLYATYTSDFKDTMDTFDSCCVKYSKFKKLVDEFESDKVVCKQLRISHYLHKPVQRLPQYRMLLERYLDHLHR